MVNVKTLMATKTTATSYWMALVLTESALRLTMAGETGAVSTNAAGRTAAHAERPAAAPTTAREFFNAGTQQLRSGKLREAEGYLESALASQQESLQTSALYNLGHVRFGQGIEALKKGPASGSATTSGKAAAQAGEEAIRKAEEALGSNDIQQMVAAYMHGKGVHKELKAAAAAVRRAQATYGTALGRWQRASGDFKSVVELKSTDTDARHNAEVVDRCIAKLVDSLHEMQMCANAMGQKKQQLGQKLKELKGRIPAPNMPPGAAGDEEEEEDYPHGPQPGQEEEPSKEGKEMTLTQEQASWVLDGFKLDGERRLPMGGTEPAQPRDRSRPTW